MATQQPCVFCDIMNGAIPAATVLDTPHAFAFLDIAPLAPGHTLLIPKGHVETLTDMEPDVLQHLVAELPKLAGAILAATGARAYNVLQNNGRDAGQVVGHVHFHIIPRAADDGLGFRWNTTTYAAGQADALQRDICQSLLG